MADAPGNLGEQREVLLVPSSAIIAAASSIPKIRRLFVDSGIDLVDISQQEQTAVLADIKRISGALVANKNLFQAAIADDPGSWIEQSADGTRWISVSPVNQDVTL